MAIRGFIGTLALAGLVGLSVSAPVSAQAPLVFLPSTKPGLGGSPEYLVAVANSRTGRILRSMPVPVEPRYTAVDHNGGRVFVTLEVADQVLVLDTASGAPVETIDTPFQPSMMQVDADAGELYIGGRNDHRIHVLDLDDLTETRVLELGDMNLGYFQLHPEQGLVLVRWHLDSQRELAILDAQTGDVVDTVADGSITPLIAVDRAANRLFSATLTKLTTHQYTADGFQDQFTTSYPFFINRIHVDEIHRWLFAASTGELAGVNLDAFYAAAPAELNAIDHQTQDVIAGGPMEVSPLDNRLYVTDDFIISPVPPLSNPVGGFGNWISVLDPESLEIRRQVFAATDGLITSRGPILAGEALPDSSAIPALGPAGIGVLILAMAAMAFRRYRLRAPAPSGPRP